jgi:hypothetical protein
MPATLREVLKTNTFEEQRQIINTIGVDFKDYVEGTGFSSTLRLVDGSASSPSVFFDTDVDLGFYKRSDGVLRFVSGGSASLDISDTRIQPYKDFIYESADAGAITPNTVGGNLALGEGYPVGTYTNRATLGGAGSGLTLDFVVLAFDGNITNTGSGYAAGTYNAAALINVSSSGSGGTANIVVAGLETSSLTGGSGYDVSQTFTNVPLQGGNGTGAIASLTTNDQGIISSFSITNQGNNGYQPGDILTVNNSDLTWVDPETQVTNTSGGSGFQLLVGASIYTVNAVNIPTTWSGTGYSVGDTVTATLDGVGTNFVFEFTNVGFIDPGSLAINEVGLNYTDGDIIRPNLSASVDAQLILTLAGNPVTRASITTAGDAIFNSINVATNVGILGNATISGTATIGSLNLQGSLTGASLSGDSIDVAGNISSSGILTVSGTTGEVSSINGDIRFSNNLLQIDDANNFVSINGPTGTTLEDYLFEVYGISKVHNNFIAAVDTGSGVSIGEDPGVGSDPVEKLVVVGNTQTSGNYYAGDGESLSPSYTFITDKTLGLYKKAINQLGLSAYNGDMATFSSSAIDFYKPLTLINESIDEYTVETGRGFSFGLYNNVTLDGGTGSDFAIDFAVAFSGDISSGGVGYTDATYINIPLQYATLTPGAISSFGTLIGGSNYSDGTYTDVPLTNISSSGSSATADITIQNGSVTEVSIVNRGSGYAINDVLSANTSDIGGPSLVIGSELLINNGGSNYSNGTYTDIALTNVSSSGSSATADITIQSGVVTNVTIVDSGFGYQIGDTLSIDGADLYAASSYTLSVVDDGLSTNYLFTGTDASTTHSNASDPTINVNLGDLLTLNVDIVGEPLYIVTTIDPVGGGYDAAYVVASVSNQGATSGSIVFDTSLVTAGTYYYVSENSTAMQGSIVVSNVAFGSGAEFEIESADTVNGSGFQINVLDVGGAGNGSGATANITISGSTVTKIEVTNPGNGLYDRNEILTVDYTDLVYVDEQGNDVTSSEPTENLEFLITDLSGVSYLNIVNYGAGYSIGDVLTLPQSFTDLSTRSGYFTFSNFATVNTGEYIYVNNGEYVYRVSIGGTLGSTPPVFGKNAVGSVSIDDGGSGYPASESYTDLNVISVTGTGTGLKVDVTTNSSGVVTSITPKNNLSGFGYNVGDSLRIDDTLLNSKILSVSVVDQAGNYEPDATYNNLPQSSTSGNGIGAIFNVSIDSNGNIFSINVVNGGVGYAVNDTITIDGAEFGDYSDEEGNNFSSGSATFAVSSLTVGSGNAFTVASTNSTQVNGDATLVWYDYQPSNFTLTVDTLATFNNVQFNSVNGEIIAKKITVDPDGINIGTTLSINNNTLSTSSGNLTLSADANSQTVISGTGALALPSGDDAQRPNSSLTGSIRYNTDRQQFEGLIQGFYVSLGGVRDVDGNTFISAELNPGDDDNTIRFFNNSTLSQFVEQNKLTYRSVSTIQKDDLTGVDEWVAGGDATSAVLPAVNYIFYGDNVYSVDNTGTFDATTPPTHETGTVINGTVDLTYVRKVFGSLDIKSANVNFAVTEDVHINTTDLVFSPQTNEIKLQTAKDNFSFGFDPTSSNSNQVIKLTSIGELSVNRGFGGQTDDYQQVLNYELKAFELRDTKLVSNTGQLDSSITSSIGIVLSSWESAVCGKIFVEIEEQFATPTTTPQRQYSEISYLIAEDAVDVLYTETNKLYNSALLGDITLSLDTSSPKNIIINFAHSTGSTTALYNVKVVSQVIRR